MLEYKPEGVEKDCLQHALGEQERNLSYVPLKFSLVFFFNTLTKFVLIVKRQKLSEQSFLQR
jgi:hypothetical protein